MNACTAYRLQNIGSVMGRGVLRPEAHRPCPSPLPDTCQQLLGVVLPFNPLAPGSFQADHSEKPPVMDADYLGWLL